MPAAAQVVLSIGLKGLYFHFEVAHFPKPLVESGWLTLPIEPMLLLLSFLRAQKRPQIFCARFCTGVKASLSCPNGHLIFKQFS